MTPDQTAEIIATETNLKVLEIYRRGDHIFYPGDVDRELLDLSTHIIVALGLAEIVENEPVLEPEENPREASIDPDAELNQQSRTPIDGGEPDILPALFSGPKRKATAEDMKAEDPIGEIGPRFPAVPLPESDETAATVSPFLAEKPGVDTVPKPAVCGAGPGTPEKKKTAKMKTITPDPKDIEFADQLREWKETEKLSNMEIERRSGISNVIVHNILSGLTKKPSAKTKQKLLKAINAKPKKKPFKNPSPASQATTPTPAKTNGKGPVQFVQLKLATWMGLNRFGNADAARHFGVNETIIRDIQNGKLPNEHVLRYIGTKIPDIGNNMHSIIGQMSTQQSNRQG